MDFSHIITFCTASFLLALAPGPDNLLVLSESITRGRLRGFILALGFTSGVVVHITLCVTGLSLIIRSSGPALMILKILSIAYLCYLAYESFKEKASVKTFNASEKNAAGIKIKSLPALYRQGIIMNIINPKVIIFFMAFLSGFVVDSGKYSATSQFIIYGLIFMLNTIIVFGSIAILAGALRPFLMKAGFWKIERIVRIVIFLALAVYLALAI